MSDTAEYLRELFLDKMAHATRSLQTRPGPSEIGGCERRLGHRLAFGAAPQAHDPSRWRPQVGTFVHSGLSEWLANDPRFIRDHRVTQPVEGTIDAYDSVNHVVLDFKCVGVTTLKAAARGQYSDKYRTQLALYGLGMEHDGYTVKALALYYLPSAGSLDDAVYAQWPYEPAIAWQAYVRLERIKAMLKVAEPAVVLARLSTQDDYCRSCPALGEHCNGFKEPVPGSTGLTLIKE